MTEQRGSWEMTEEEKERIGNAARWLPSWAWPPLGGLVAGIATWLLVSVIIGGLDQAWLIVSGLCFFGFFVNFHLSLRDVDREYAARRAEADRRFNLYMSSRYETWRA